jgi:hypothetical protein
MDNKLCLNKILMKVMKKKTLKQFAFVGVNFSKIGQEMSSVYYIGPLVLLSHYCSTFLLHYNLKIYVFIFMEFIYIYRIEKTWV